MSVFLIGIMSGCGLGSGKKKPAPDSNVARTYTKDKKLVSEMEMQDGKRHGVGKTYYRNGVVNLEMTYVDDKREGKSRRFYETGLLFQETDYVNDRVHGIQKKFGIGGVVLSEARYEYDEPCTGLVEFNDGKRRSSFPSIVIRVIDKLQSSGTYILRLSVTEGASTVIFYKGNLTPSGCLHQGLMGLPKGPARNSAEMRYDLSPGQFYMEEVNFIAAVTTRSGNTYVTQKTFPLSIKN
ncbi:MAG: hypothetical protein SH819_11280 [Cytophagales bacterium]|nr:hypothetical protein [Cytophagales bacterium]